MNINDLRSITTLISFVVFLGIMWWAFRRGSSKSYEEAACIPFADAEQMNLATGSDKI